MVLGKMEQTDEAYLGEKVTQAVVTVPAIFNDTQRRPPRTRYPAGLTILRMSTNPPPPPPSPTVSTKTPVVPTDPTSSYTISVGELSTSPSGPLTMDGNDCSETIARAKFEELNLYLSRKTLKPVEQVLKDASMKREHRGHPPRRWLYPYDSFTKFSHSKLLHDVRDRHYRHSRSLIWNANAVRPLKRPPPDLSEQMYKPTPPRVVRIQLFPTFIATCDDDETHIRRCCPRPHASHTDPTAIATCGEGMS
ncbi:Endoplasmic reticulum chaperone BiP [Tulasnella sp. 417]|nr:Endoplasmic reticulum chaperone BiP [Tulasnella sp. 417]